MQRKSTQCRWQKSWETSSKTPNWPTNMPSIWTRRCRCRLLCITGARDSTRSRKPHRHSVLETYFQKLSDRAVSPHRATPGSVGYDLYTPYWLSDTTKGTENCFYWPCHCATWGILRPVNVQVRPYHIVWVGSKGWSKLTLTLLVT